MLLPIISPAISICYRAAMTTLSIQYNTIQYNKIQIMIVGLGGLVVTCSPRDPRFAGSNSAEVDGFFRI